jgi:endonuclease/exonuclease/phosphatase (EEP) superfamily protein YafD
MSPHDASAAVGGRPARRAAGRFDRLLVRLAALLALATVASALARFAWPFELITHFRFQMAACALLLLAVALLRWRPTAAVLAVLALAANGAPLVPYVLGAPVSTAVAGGGITLMSANVHYRNADYAALLEEVRATDPDVLGLLEVDQQWLDALALDAAYPWSVRYPEEGPWGLALYSKLPLRELPAGREEQPGPRAAIHVELEHDGGTVNLVLAHVAAPTTPARADLRNVQLRKIGEHLAATAGKPRILMGDLNITPWSPYYQDLVAQAGLVNAARGFGYVPTWPTGLNPMKIPIDHCLVSQEVGVVSFRTGPAFGSDHLPIVVEVTEVDAQGAPE